MSLPKTFDPSSFESLAGTTAAAWLTTALERVATDGEKGLLRSFPALARKTGRDGLQPARVQDGDYELECAAWRVCDVAGRHLVLAADASDAILVDLFMHGDFEERSNAMRQHALMPIRTSTLELLGEAQRTNTQTHFEALVCDSNLLARAMSDDRFDVEDGYKILLKAAFVDLPLDRFFGVLAHASEDLSAYVMSLATEREAAGRQIWPDTNHVIACAPLDDSVDRIVAGLQHGDARHRLASGRGLSVLSRKRPGDATLIAAATARIEVEDDTAVRTVLQDIVRA